MINYRKKNGKYIIHKDGAYLAITPEQVSEIYNVVSKIIKEEINNGNHRK